MREWIAKNIFGLVRAPDARELDIFEEMETGKSILLDSGAQSPIQHLLRYICSCTNFIDKNTIEFSHNRSPRDGYMRTGRFKLDDNQILTGENLAHLSNRVGDWKNYQPNSLNRNFRQYIESIKSAMRSGKKTIAEYDCNYATTTMRDEERIIEAIVEIAEELWIAERNMPFFSIQLAPEYENEYVIELLKRLQNIAPTIIIRVVHEPTPFTPSLTADIHIVERTDFQKYLRSDAEVLFDNNQRAVITTHPSARKFSKWDYKSYEFEKTPSIAAYNDSFASKSSREAFQRHHIRAY